MKLAAGLRLNHRGHQNDLLGSQSKRCACNRRGEIKTFGDFPPDLSVDHLHQPPFFNDKLVELIKIKNLFRHDWDPINW